MPQATIATIKITFLGTVSAQPSSTRNHSSLALRLDGDVWLFDCGEATQHQIQKSSVKMGRIKKVFITHTHGDHFFGIVPLMAGLLNGAGGMVEGSDDPRMRGATSSEVETLEIYGPLGTRAYIRNSLRYTYTLLGGSFVVHELRFPSDPPSGDYTELPRHPCELPGRNILQGDGVWSDIFAIDTVTVSAAPILHSVPCVGYVIHERPIPGKMNPKKYISDIKRTRTPMSVMARLQQGETVELTDGTVMRGPPRRPGRKIAILGDTYDPSPIADLAAEADVLVHEATIAYLPDIDLNTKVDDTELTVEKRAKSRGHSTPQMAGAFATRIGAKKLLLNHFSARYAGDDDVDPEAAKVMMAIRALAESTFTGEVVCTRDFMTLDVPQRS